MFTTAVGSRGGVGAAPPNLPRIEDQGASLTWWAQRAAGLVADRAAPGGRVCELGFLGGPEPVIGFNPIAVLPAGVQLSFYGSAMVLGAPDFPLAGIPLQDDRQGRGRALPRQARRVFGFDEIVRAHRVMEEGPAAGEMVVAVS